jgi:hypothetical protein
MKSSNFYFSSSKVSHRCGADRKQARSGLSTRGVCSKLSTVIGTFLFVIDLIQSGLGFRLSLEWRMNKVGGARYFAADEGLTTVINHCPLYIRMINEILYSIDTDLRARSE